MEPSWFSVVIAGAGIIFSGFSAYLGVKLAVTRLEGRVTALEKESDYNEEWRHETASRMLNDHELQIGLMQQRRR
jgi:flavin-dependent dehydrogenase